MKKKKRPTKSYRIKISLLQKKVCNVCVRSQSLSNSDTLPTRKDLRCDIKMAHFLRGMLHAEICHFNFWCCLHPLRSHCCPLVWSILRQLLQFLQQISTQTADIHKKRKKYSEVAEKMPRVLLQ